MNTTTVSPTPVVDPVAVSAKTDTSRCHYRYPNGKRCSLPGLPVHSGTCLRHSQASTPIALPVHVQNDLDDLSADLLPELSEFNSGVDINKFLARLLILVTKGRISPRRASVLAYISNQLLHSHRAIVRDNLLQTQKEKDQPLLFDYSDWPDPEDGSGIRGPACHRRAVLALHNQEKSSS